MKTVADYINLITSQHADKPKFVAMVEAVVTPLVELQATYDFMANSFDLDTAVGEQLDFIGQWIGRSRAIDIPITNYYFSWDIDGLGWDEGVWQGRFDEDSGFLTLDDDLYRLLLRGKIAANSWDGTLPGIKKVFEQVFRDPSYSIVVLDNYDMSMTIKSTGAPIDPITRAIIEGGYIPVKAEAVRIIYDLAT